MVNLFGVFVFVIIGIFSYFINYYGNVCLLQLFGFYNIDLKLEQIFIIDFSLFIEFFKWLILGFNLYCCEMSDVLLDVFIFFFNGFNIMKCNIGVLCNEGYELIVVLKVFDILDWCVFLCGLLVYNCNKVISLYYIDCLYISEIVLIFDYEVGKVYNMFYGLKLLGINFIIGFLVF